MIDPKNNTTNRLTETTTRAEPGPGGMRVALTITRKPLSGTISKRGSFNDVDA